MMKALPLIVAALVPWTSLIAQPAVTIYNQNFAVVRDTVPLDLKAGVNDVRFADTTEQLEPDSVILRDPAGKIALQILEQNYRNDPVTEGRLLSYYEGKTIDFVTVTSTGEKKTVQGKIIRSGYSAPNPTPFTRVESGQPIIEVDGKLQFSLPGQPIFPALADDSLLKPSLVWQIETSKPGKLDAELAYITGGISWQATYNIVAPEKGDSLDLIGWVTIHNQTGKTFENAQIKLMAGDVNKVQPEMSGVARRNGAAMVMMAAPTPAVTEKSFDEFHLYTLQRPSTLRDSETKQIEFINATGVKSERIFVYDGLQETGWRQQRPEYLRDNQGFGTVSNTKVAIVREIKNTEANHLGMPLPEGRVRLYQQDGDKRLEFIGENTIDHTAKNETIRFTTGNAFDLVGERKQTDYKIDSSRKTLEESFEIKLRNRKKEPVEIRVVEHLYRGYQWEITAKSDPFEKTSSREIEFRVPVKPDEEKTITYTVRYTW